MRGIFQTPALIIQRALYDGLIHAEPNGVTLDNHPEVLADRPCRRPRASQRAVSVRKLTELLRRRSGWPCAKSEPSS